MKLEEVIEDYSSVVKEKIMEAEAAKKKLDQLIELQKIKNKRLNREKLTKKDVQRAMSVLCWGNFAGCCSPVKKCPWNMAASDALGIDYKDLYEKKKKIVFSNLPNLLLQHSSDI